MKIYLNNVKESWIIDRLRSDWYKHNKLNTSSNQYLADIIWIISPWVWKKLSKKQLEKKFVVCTIHHIDFNKFDDHEEKDFYERDKFVDFYHVISLKTKSQLEELTDKKIISLPFWVDPSTWFYIDNKESLKKDYGFSEKDFVIGSFQRDTEGSDLTSPKLIKGPDIFLKIAEDMFNANENVKILLTGKNRNYLIENLTNKSIPFKYLEMVDLKQLNELYNLLDLYVVSSRVEGGPQAILECAASKTPIVSTDVGVASEILHQDSIYSPGTFDNAKSNVEYAFSNVQKYFLPNYMNKFIEMFEENYNL